MQQPDSGHGIETWKNSIVRRIDNGYAIVVVVANINATVHLTLETLEGVSIVQHSLNEISFQHIAVFSVRISSHTLYLYLLLFLVYFAYFIIIIYKIDYLASFLREFHVWFLIGIFFWSLTTPMILIRIFGTHKLLIQQS